jgi:hypothetical protein
LLRLLDGKATVQDVVDASALGEFDVYRLLVDLLNRELIEKVELEPVIKEVAVPRGSRRPRVIPAILQALVLAVAAFGIATLGSNPYTPWKLAAQSRESRLLKTYVSRNRLERVEQALQAYYLDRGAMPDSLDALAAGGFLPVGDTFDPWGRRYSFRVGPTAYEIGERGRSEGGGDPLLIRHPFSASQRMVLQGGLSEHDASNHP